jgi:hypothetical protein
MTTRYKLVPVVATDDMFKVGQDMCDKPTVYAENVYAAMLAAAPKELPEEVVEAAAAGMYADARSRMTTTLAHPQLCNWRYWDGVPHWIKEMFRQQARAALLAVMGASDAG